MRFLALSDTHRKHNKLRNLPHADAVIHAGDITSKGTYAEVRDFLDWYGGLPYDFRIFIAGNHDFLFEQMSPEELEQLVPPNVIYLNDCAVTINGIKIWGSPVTPWFHDWAFNRNRGTEIARHWNMIPDDIDILVAHGPAQGILDYTSSGIHAGCEELVASIERIKPAYFISGHIHEAYGQKTVGDTTFINASVLDERYQLRNAPVIFDLEKT